MNRDRRRQAYNRGLFAELLCMACLILKGYAILAWRYKRPQGEIDVIARKGRMVVCVEVKARALRATALESVTLVAQRRIAQAASAFIATHASYAHHDLRFDVMVVTSTARVYHLKNAWSVA